MKHTTFLLSMAALISSGCATLPSHPELVAQAEAIGYGADLDPSHQEAIKAEMIRILKDGFSAQYQFGTPYKGWVTGMTDAGKPGLVAVGWIVPVMVNGKNSYGAYIGFEEYKFLVHDNRVIYRRGPNGVWIRVAK